MKKIITLLLLGTTILAKADQSNSNFAIPITTIVSSIPKNIPAYTKNPYILSAGAVTIGAVLLTKLYIKRKYQKINQTYANHQDGYCDGCHQQKISPNSCKTCSNYKSFFWGYCQYSNPRYYCFDCLKALKNNRCNCYYCGEEMMSAVDYNYTSDTLMIPGNKS